MAYEEKIRTVEMPHHVIIDSRSRISVSGATDVESFDESAVSLVTTKGAMMIRGRGLHVDKLSLDNGELNVEGMIDEIRYEDENNSGGGFWSRLFR